jgi:type IV pilus assembly protein PilX
VRRRTTTRAQRGATLLVILFTVAVMLLGGLMMARSTLTDTLLAGNVANSQAAAQAADVGIATAFEELKAMTATATGSNQAGWYAAAPLADADLDGLPDIPSDWSTARNLQVGPYEVRYVIERLCKPLPVTDNLSQCLMSEDTSGIVSKNDGEEAVVLPAQRTYRTTVRVTGPRGTQSWAQALLTRP